MISRRRTPQTNRLTIAALAVAWPLIAVTLRITEQAII